MTQGVLQANGQIAVEPMMDVAEVASAVLHMAGLPLIGFSAGSIVCGPNILTSKDMNTV